MTGTTRQTRSKKPLHPGYRHLDPDATDDRPPKPARRTKAEMEAARKQEAEMKAAQELVFKGKIQSLADVQEHLRMKDRMEQSSPAALALPAKLRRAKLKGTFAADNTSFGDDVASSSHHPVVDPSFIEDYNGTCHGDHDGGPSSASL